jgi:hypothetical protein
MVTELMRTSTTTCAPESLCCAQTGGYPTRKEMDRASGLRPFAVNPWRRRDAETEPGARLCRGLRRGERGALLLAR